MLSVVLSDVMLSFMMLSVVMQSVVMLSVAVPFYPITMIFHQPLSARGGEIQP